MEETVDNISSTIEDLSANVAESDNISDSADYDFEPLPPSNIVIRYAKSFPVEALQWLGNNKEEFDAFYDGQLKQIGTKLVITINDEERIMPIGSYLIKGIDMFYVLKQHLFEQMYTPLEVPTTLTSLADYEPDEDAELKNLEISTVEVESTIPQGIPNSMSAFMKNKVDMPFMNLQQQPMPVAPISKLFDDDQQKEST